MKILLLTTHMETGGIPVYVAELARGLKRAGHRPIVVSSGGGLEERLAREGVPHHRIPWRTSSELSPRLWLFSFWKAVRLIRREKPDLLHAHTRVTQVLACAAGLLTRVPVVTTCHGLYRFRIGRRIFPCWGRKVMAVSEPTLEQLTDRYRIARRDRAALIWNGVDVERFMEPPDPEAAARFRRDNGLSGDPVVGAVCRLSAVKGLELLLQAAPPLLKEFPRLQVLLVGEGPERANLVRLAYELGIADRVVISHPVEDVRVPLSCLRVFAAPAFQEGFGLSLAEAMAAGVPPVAADAEGPSRIIEHGVSGLLVSPGSAEGITQALRALLSDPQKHAAIASAARRRVRERFDIRRMTEEVEAVYAQAVA